MSVPKRDPAPLEVSLKDTELLEELELLVELMVAAHDFLLHMPHQQIDRILGVHTQP